MIFLLAFIALSTGSWVFVHELKSVMPTNVSLMLSTIFAIALFHLVNLKNVSTMYRVLLKSKATYLMLMVCTLVMWGSSFFVSSFSPTFSQFVQMGMGAALGSLSILQGEKTRENFISACSINAVILLALFYLILNYSFSEVLSALAIIAIVSFFDFYYSHVSHKINSLGLSSSQVIASRFWLLLVCSILLQSHEMSDEYFTGHNLLIAFGLAVFTFMLPIYFYQKSVVSMGPDLALIGSGVLPLTTYIAERLFTKSQTPVALGVLSLLLSLAIMVPALYFKYSEGELKQGV
ncbi:MAG: hypothetical protein ACRC02_12765 [Vogesella sp.]|uniref:hypothetical protein n=1 Tax=Vogesella sp. TaxID=1904252 RepID=UPI003F2D0CF9